MPEGGRKAQKGENSDPLTLQLSKRNLVLDAEAARVVWARVKGYPWWPAQILSKAAAKQHLGGVTHKSKSDAPVIFFGTSEIAWIGAKDITNWENGMAQSFHNKGRKNKKFIVALEQVRDFLSLTTERTTPAGWWCAPPARGALPPPEEPVSSDDEPDMQLHQEHAAMVSLMQHQQHQQQLQDYQASTANQQPAGLDGRFAAADRMDSNGGSFGGAAAVAAATAAAMAAEDAADLEQAAATAAAVINRSLNSLQRHSSGRLEEDTYTMHGSMHNAAAGARAGSSRPGRQQLWGASGSSRSRLTSFDGSGPMELVQQGSRQQRKRSAARLSYGSDSGASDSEDSEEAGARDRATAAGRGSRRTGSRGAGRGSRGSAGGDGSGMAGPSFLPVKKRCMLLQQADGGGSESEMTDTESLAMAALAMAQLANGGAWDAQPPQEDGQLQVKQELHPEEIAVASHQQDVQVPACEDKSAVAAVMRKEQQQQAAATADGSSAVLSVQLRVDNDVVGLGVRVEPDEASAAVVSESAAVVGPSVHSLLAAAASLPEGDTAEDAWPEVPEPAAGHYAHGGVGLPCSSSWQYTVPMPGAAAAVQQPLQAAAVDGDSSSGSNSAAQQAAEQPRQSAAVPPVAVCAATSYYKQLFAGFAVSAAAQQAVEEAEQQQQQQQAGSAKDAAASEQQALLADLPDGLAALDAAAAVLAAAAAAAASAAGNTQVVPGLRSSLGMPAVGHSNVDDAAAAAAAAAVLAAAAVEAVQPAHGPLPLAAATYASDVEAGASAAAAAAAVAGRQPRPGPLSQHIAAANAAISAAFTASSSLHHRQQQQHIANNSTSSYHHGAASDRSVGSAGQRVNGGSGSTGTKRRNTSSAAVTAAQAAAMASAHVITPPNPVLDAAVASLLLQGEGPVLPHQRGLPDSGFTLPRELLMNRPPKFEWLKRNLFVSRERPKRLAKDEVQVCNCRVHRVRQPDGSELLVGCQEGHCLNRLSFIHCDPRTCPCGQYCTNKPFHLLKAPQLDVFLTENRGHGVRMLQPLAAGQFVVEYAGEVIDQAELHRRMEAARDSGEQHFYIMELGPGLFIDARRKGNHARLLNSCCDPNCETQKWRDAATGEVRIGIFTTRPVAEYEELTYDYMFEHSGVSAMAHGFRCMCGAKNCRGTMDINPERKKDWGRRLEVFWEGDGVFYRGTVTGYSVSSGKHTIMYDDGDVERVKLSEVPHRWLDGDASPHSSAQPASGGSPGPSAELQLQTSKPLSRPPGAAAADSGSWSQTEQEASAMAVDDSTAAAAAALPLGSSRPAGGRVHRPPPGLSPLGQAAPASAAADQVAGVADDAAAAADALVTLGMAAEAELQQMEQEQKQQLGPSQQQQEVFVRPAVKRQRLGDASSQQQHHYYESLHDQQQQLPLPHMYHGAPRGQQPGAHWQHSSSGMQPAGGQFGPLGPSAALGPSPVSPRERSMPSPGSGRMRHAGGTGWVSMHPGASGQPYSSQQQQLHQLHQHRISKPGGSRDLRRMDVDADSHGEFLPWEQLLSGLRAIKTQGPPLFHKQQQHAGVQQQPGAASAIQQRRQQPCSSNASCASKFGQLLHLVGHMQPVIQQRVQQLEQQPPQPPTVVPMTARVGSLGGSSASSSSSCQLPLFCSPQGVAASSQQQQPLQPSLYQEQPQQQLQQQQQQYQQQRISQLRAGGDSCMLSAGSSSSNRMQLPQKQQQMAQRHPPGLPAVAANSGLLSMGGSNTSSPSYPVAAAGLGVPPRAPSQLSQLQQQQHAQLHQHLQQQLERSLTAGTAGSFTEARRPASQQVPHAEDRQRDDAQHYRQPPQQQRAAAPAAAAAPEAGACHGLAPSAGKVSCPAAAAAAKLLTLGSAGSGSSTATAESALAPAAAAAAVSAVGHGMQPPNGMMDMRQVQAVAQ